MTAAPANAGVAVVNILAKLLHAAADDENGSQSEYDINPGGHFCLLYLKSLDGLMEKRDGSG